MTNFLKVIERRSLVDIFLIVGAVVAAAAVVVVEAVVVEVVGLEALQTLPLGVRPTPASLRSSSS